ncbi:MAG: hypothetical protein U0T81_00220 [Saprospiraceae bacterium]
MGIEIYSGGGETADVGDIVRTIDVGITAFGRMRRDRVLDINIQPGCNTWICFFRANGVRS